MADNDSPDGGTAADRDARVAGPAKAAVAQPYGGTEEQLPGGTPDPNRRGLAFYQQASFEIARLMPDPPSDPDELARRGWAICELLGLVVLESQEEDAQEDALLAELGVVEDTTPQQFADKFASHPTYRALMDAYALAKSFESASDGLYHELSDEDVAWLEAEASI